MLEIFSRSGIKTELMFQIEDPSVQIIFNTPGIKFRKRFEGLSVRLCCLFLIAKCDLGTKYDDYVVDTEASSARIYQSRFNEA